MVIQGRFDGGCPVVDIEIDGLPAPQTAIVDTGFNGYLMLSASVIKNLGWEYFGSETCATASGVSYVEVYQGFIYWMGRKTRVLALSSPFNLCLIGMDLLHPYKIEIHRAKSRILIGE